MAQLSAFARRKPRFKVQPRVLVLCEDSKSCLDYLQDASRHFRSYADIEIAHCNRTDPKGIVVEAAKRLKDFDTVYCAIDRDSHHGFAAALALAATYHGKIDVVVSYPSYEFWLLLHFRKSSKPYAPAGGLSAADRLIRDLRVEEGMNEYAKGAAKSLFSSLLPKLPRARQFASEVLIETPHNGMNPSTRLHELLEIFQLLGSPPKV